jgi:hypothetical protein
VSEEQRRSGRKSGATLRAAAGWGVWLRFSLVTGRCGHAPHSCLAIRSNLLPRGPSQYFNSLLRLNRAIGSRAHPARQPGTPRSAYSCYYCRILLQDPAQHYVPLTYRARLALQLPPMIGSQASSLTRPTGFQPVGDGQDAPPPGQAGGMSSVGSVAAAPGALAWLCEARSNSLQ